MVGTGGKGIGEDRRVTSITGVHLLFYYAINILVQLFYGASNGLGVCRATFVIYQFARTAYQDGSSQARFLT
jgi:hypothetical protein